MARGRGRLGHLPQRRTRNSHCDIRSPVAKDLHNNVFQQKPAFNVSV